MYPFEAKVLYDNVEGEAAVSLTDGTFSWDSEDSERATLRK